MRHIDSDFAGLKDHKHLNGYGVYVNKYSDNDGNIFYNLTAMVSETPKPTNLLAIADLQDLIESSAEIEHLEDDNWEQRRILNARYFNEITSQEEVATLNIFEQKGYHQLSDIYTFFCPDLAEKIQNIQAG